MLAETQASTAAAGFKIQFTEVYLPRLLRHDTCLRWKIRCMGRKRFAKRLTLSMSFQMKMMCVARDGDSPEKPEIVKLDVVGPECE